MADQDDRPRLVVVGSSSKKAGKSTLATFLVRELKADNALKVSSGNHGPLGIISEPGIIECAGTDTGHLSRAGAKTVVWVNAPQDDIPVLLQEALSLFPAGGILVVEGNSAMRQLEADFSVFIMTVPLDLFKPSALEALPSAALVLIDLRGTLTGRDPLEIGREVSGKAPGAQLVFFRDDSEMEKARREVLRAARSALGIEI